MKKEKQVTLGLGGGWGSSLCCPSGEAVAAHKTPILGPGPRDPDGLSEDSSRNCAAGIGNHRRCWLARSRAFPGRLFTST